MVKAIEERLDEARKSWPKKPVDGVKF